MQDQEKRESMKRMKMGSIKEKTKREGIKDFLNYRQIFVHLGMHL